MDNMVVVVVITSLFLTIVEDHVDLGDHIEIEMSLSA